jgi:hypothetical protein
MSPIVKGGVALGIATIVISLIFGFTGMYKNASLGWIFQLAATAVEVGLLVWVLRQTAVTRGYGGQIVATLAFVIVAIPFILANGYLFSGVFFPDAMDFAMQNQENALAARGMSDTDIEQNMTAMAPFFTPIFSAIMGAIMTGVVGLLTGLIAAIWIRKKD